MKIISPYIQVNYYKAKVSYNQAKKYLMKSDYEFVYTANFHKEDFNLYCPKIGEILEVNLQGNHEYSSAQYQVLYIIRHHEEGALDTELVDNKAVMYHHIMRGETIDIYMIDYDDIIDDIVTEEYENSSDDNTEEFLL